MSNFHSDLLTGLHASTLATYFKEIFQIPIPIIIKIRIITGKHNLRKSKRVKDNNW